MNQLSEESISFARDILSKTVTEEGFHPAITIAGAIRDWIDALDYGVGEALLQGRTLRYPHEVREQLNCAEAGIATYVVTKVAGLNPRLLRAINYNNLESDHFIVDVPLENKHLLVDPFFSEFGSAQYFPSHLEIHRGEPIGGSISVCLQNDDEMTVKKIPYTSLEELTEEELHTTIRHFNSAQGFFDYFSSGQKLTNFSLPEGTMGLSVCFSSENGMFSIKQEYIDRFLFRYVDELLWTYNDQAQVTQAKRKLILAQGNGWCSYKDPVFTMEQDVSIDIDSEHITLHPWNDWNITLVKNIPDEEKQAKLKAFCNYVRLTKQKGGLLYTPQERRATFDANFHHQICYLDRRNKYIDEANSGDTIYLSLVMEQKENGAKLRKLNDVSKQWGEFAQRNREGFIHILDQERFIEEYKEGKHHDLNPELPPKDFIFQARKYALTMADFYAPIATRALRHQSVKSLFKNAHEKAKWLTNSIP